MAINELHATASASSSVDKYDDRKGFALHFDESGSATEGAIGFIELLLGFVALTAWFVLFAGGVLIGTAPHRDAVANPPSSLIWLKSFSVVLLFWTITNVEILSCIAAFLGALGRRTRFTVAALTTESIAVPSFAPKSVAIFYVSAVVRGFGIYALSFAGLLVLATQTFQSPEQGEYLRLAATLSVISFYVGSSRSAGSDLVQALRKPGAVA